MNHIKKYRDRLFITQTELSKLCGLTQGSISQYESQKRTPDGPALCALAKALGVSPEAILGQAPEQSLPSTKLICAQAKTILDWWTENAETVAALENYAIARVGECDQPLEKLLEFLRSNDI